VGLQWNDFDFDKSTLLVQRGVVHGRVDDVKTDTHATMYNRPELQRVVGVSRGLLPTERWLFANPATRSPITRRKSRRSTFGSAKAAGIKSKSAGKRPAQVTVRGSTRRRADGSAGKLMRHASIQTTMNIYGRAIR